MFGTSHKNVGRVDLDQKSVSTFQLLQFQLIFFLFRGSFVCRNTFRLINVCSKACILAPTNEVCVLYFLDSLCSQLPVGSWITRKQEENTLEENCSASFIEKRVQTNKM